MKKIVAKYVTDINELLSDRNIKIRLTESAIDLLIEKGFDKKMGARPLNRAINDMIKVPISKKILFESLADGSIITVDRNENSLTFSVIVCNMCLPLEGNAKVDEDGFIRLD